MNVQLVAAIDVGSHALRMKIGQFNANGQFLELESFRKTAVLGHDTFNNGKMSFESVDKVCNILTMFKKSLNDYHITGYKAMATSAIREAKNRDYIIDQIKLKTGLDIEVIDNSQEQFLMHKAIKMKLHNFDQLIEEGAVLVAIGAGSIQITLYKESKLISSQNVKLGALRIKELLGALEKETMSYYKILEEFIHINTQSIDFFKCPSQYHHFIAVSGEISIISRLIHHKDSIGDEVECIRREPFNDLYQELLHKSTEEIIMNYGIERARAEIIIPSMILLKKFLSEAHTDEIIVPNVSLTDGMIVNLYEEVYNLDTEEITQRDIMTCVKQIAAKYDHNDAHAWAVERHALAIFDGSKGIHGLSEERLLLRIAALLHDVGKFISLDNIFSLSYNIISSIEIFGISHEQLEIIANVARYNSAETPKMEDINFNKLSSKNKVIVGKLAAILRLANALDKSHKQKIDILSVEKRNKELVIRGKCTANALLEIWTFRRKAEFFKEVFGVTPVLIIEKDF